MYGHRGDHQQAFKNIWQLRSEVITSNEQTEYHPTTSEQLCQLNVLQNIYIEGEASSWELQLRRINMNKYLQTILRTVIMQYNLIQFNKFRQMKV
jgi:hypothetical protein